MVYVFQAIYEDVKGLSYLWFGRLLLEILGSLQHSGAPRSFPGGAPEGAPEEGPSSGVPKGGSGGPQRFEGPLTVFVWRARADFFLQRALRSGGGASGALKGSLAPSLVGPLLFDFAAILQQLRVNPKP